MCNSKQGREFCEPSVGCFFVEGEDAVCEPQLTTTTTQAPDWCMGDSYKANDKCMAAQSQGKCENKGCRWIETDDPNDCVLTTTTTTTILPNRTRCAMREDRD